MSTHRFFALVVFLVSCGGDPASDAGAPPIDSGGPTDAGPRQPLDYADATHWLCGSGASPDECLDADLTSTAVLADGSMLTVPHEVAADPTYDCFYVYPTVALGGRFGNVDESVLLDHAPMLDPLLSQAARFTGQCRVFAPLYRQITFTTYTRSDAEIYLQRAFVDVEAAFAHYLANDAGDRPFVIMGHSQGARMTRTLVERVIAPDPALRARMIAALIIGGDVTVAAGSTTGGSFADIPVCTSDDEVGCVVAYRSFAEGFPPSFGVSAGVQLACANPAALGGGEGRFTGTYFPTSTHQDAYDVHAEWDPSIVTPFVLYADFFTGECVIDAEGRSYLEVGARPETGDVRLNPVPFDHALFSPSLLGLHVLDYNFPLADLMRIVAIKAAALGG